MSQGDSGRLVSRGWRIVLVLVVSDLRLYRDGAAGALVALEEVRHVTAADSASSAVTAARRSRADVVLLDMSMKDALAAVRALLTAVPTAKVVALGADEHEHDAIVACAELGVTGYLSRNATVEEMRACLRAARRGEAWCSGRVAATLIRHISWTGRPRAGLQPLQLTRREQDVLTLVEGGLANKEIAAALDLQLSTVKNHVHNLFTKLGVEGRAELAVLRTSVASRG